MQSRTSFCLREASRCSVSRLCRNIVAHLVHVADLDKSHLAGWIVDIAEQRGAATQSCVCWPLPAPQRKRGKVRFIIGD
jgi:hypothetical protein